MRSVSPIRMLIFWLRSRARLLLMRLVGRFSRRRVPVVRQLSAVECGAACLSMILSYHGRETRVSECREELGLGRDGVTGLTIAKAARAHGLRVKAYSLGPEDFKFVTLPAIMHWEFNHFVVVEKWSPESAEIVDPAQGRRFLSAAEFNEGFTGVVLTFEPGVHFERMSKRARPLWRRYLLKYIFQAPGLIAQIIGASLLLQLLGLALPLFTKVIVDFVLPFGVQSVLTLFGVGMLLLIVSQMTISYLRAAMLIYLQTRLDSRMMLDFFEHLLALPFKFFQQRSSGDLLMRLGSNSMIREMLTSQTLSVFLDGTLVLVYLLIVLTLSPLFGLLVLALGLIQVSLVIATTTRMHRLMQRDLTAQAQSQSYLVEALTGIETLKATGAEDRALDHWSNLFFNQLNISLQRSRLSVMIETAMTTLRVLSPILLLWFGAYRVLNGSMSLGTMLALNSLAAAFLMPLSSLVSNGQRLQLVGSHLDRIADVLDSEPEQDSQSVEHAPPLSGRIEFDSVSFRYNADAPLVLKDISFTIEPGQKVGLVGRTGSGKSSLGKLMLGLYTPTEGEILYDGLRLETLEFRSLRQQFGVVLQEPLLFSGSIRQSIAFDAELDLEQVTDAARLAAIHDEIMAMPMGYETLVSEGSGGLAGGQCQRLTLARALVHKPVLLLLDEATSHLDVVTERQVDENLSGLNCTRVVIAHRLSTIRNADLILVLEQGEIVERGTHEELLALGGRYVELVQAQLETEESIAIRSPSF
ncbi:MAG TPA: peptidase domain-containing ABC transporter [Pyrinomonadaceae bacterium]|nr:peptidase domain-containing ABC transporter [Pyrinomonadaceae bacterium]